MIVVNIKYKSLSSLINLIEKLAWKFAIFISFQIIYFSWNFLVLLTSFWNIIFAIKSLKRDLFIVMVLHVYCYYSSNSLKPKNCYITKSKGPSFHRLIPNSLGTFESVYLIRFSTSLRTKPILCHFSPINGLLMNTFHHVLHLIESVLFLIQRLYITWR